MSRHDFLSALMCENWVGCCISGMIEGLHRTLQTTLHYVRRGVADTALGLLQPIPLVGLLAGKASEILFGIQQYYTYTSAS